VDAAVPPVPEPPAPPAAFDPPVPVAPPVAPVPVTAPEPPEPASEGASEATFAVQPRAQSAPSATLETSAGSDADAI
jgi:hypothetical protein